MGRREKSQENTSIFRERLKAARRKAALTQAQASELAGISGVTLSKLEQGVNSPTLEVLVALSKALNTSPNQLVGWDVGDPQSADPERRSLLLRLEHAAAELPHDWLKMLSDLAEKLTKDIIR